MKDLNVDFSKELGIATPATERAKKIKALKAKFKDLSASEILDKLESDTTLIK